MAFKGMRNYGLRNDLDNDYMRDAALMPARFMRETATSIIHTPLISAQIDAILLARAGAARPASCHSDVGVGDHHSHPVRGNMPHKTDLISKLCKGDPITYTLRTRLGLPTWAATLLLTSALNIPVFILVSTNNLWLNHPNSTGLLNDFAWWVYQLTAVPAMIYFLLWMPDGIHAVYNGLRVNQVIKPSGKPAGKGDPFDAFLGRFAHVYAHRAWTWLAFAGVSLFMFSAAIPEHRTFRSWQTSNDLVFWYHEFFWYLVFFIGAIALIKTFLAIQWFNRLFNEFDADVRVLHPDGAGGLSPLGTFSVKIGYMIGLLGFSIVVVIWSHAAYLIPGTAFDLSVGASIISLAFAYLVLAPIVFFAPIGSAHIAMENARHSFIMAVSDQFETDFTRINSLLDKDANSLKKGLEKIESLQKIHTMAVRFPVWPFNTSNLVRFFSSTLSPIAFALLPSVINFLFFR